MTIVHCRRLALATAVLGVLANCGTGTNEVPPEEEIVPTKPPPRPSLALQPSRLQVVLPDNCWQQFAIINDGDSGTVLDYVVADDGSLGGFLDLENAIGSVPAGESSFVRVRVRPDFSYVGFGSIAGWTLVLGVDTPGASNNTETSIAVGVVDHRALRGTWRGEWTGLSSYTETVTAPAHGTWTLYVDDVDVVRGHLVGFLDWVGSDVCWLQSGVPVSVVPNRTIALGPHNTSVANGGCLGVHVVIDGAAGAQNPSYEFYGPWLQANFDLNSQQVQSYGNGYYTHAWCSPNLVGPGGGSSGSISGQKEPF